MFQIRNRSTGMTLMLAAAALTLPAVALRSEPEPGERGVGARNRAPAAAEKAPVAGVMTPEELRFLELLNRERAVRHEVELRPDSLLVEVARAHSREMAERGYFDHVSPTPGSRTPMDRYLRAVHRRPPHACVGENLFYCSIFDVERGHRAFMNSPGHRANILYAPFRRGGVGIYTAENGEFWVTEMFLTTEGLTARQPYAKTSQHG